MFRQILIFLLLQCADCQNEEATEACPSECSCCRNTDECRWCDSECIDGYFGLYCMRKCPVNCVKCEEHPRDYSERTFLHNGYCTECKDGYYSTEALYQCQTACPTVCPTCTSDSECTSCMIGFILDNGKCTLQKTVITAVGVVVVLTLALYYRRRQNRMFRNPSRRSSIQGDDQVPGRLRDNTKMSGWSSEQCEACLSVNKKVNATIWCSNCDELLCKSCQDVHCKMKLMKAHKLLSIQEMKRRKEKHTLQTKCNQHDGEPFKYFCDDHSVLCCSQCFRVNHRYCNSVVYIPEVVTCESKEFKSLERLLLTFEQRLKSNKEDGKRNLRVIKRHTRGEIPRFAETGERIKTLIDGLVKVQIKKVKKEEDDATIAALNETDAEIDEDVRYSNDMIKAVRDDNDQLFIAMKHLQGEAKRLKSKLDASERKNYDRMYEFQLNQLLTRVLKEFTEFGRLKDSCLVEMRKMEELNDNLQEVMTFKEKVGPVGLPMDLIVDAISISTDHDICLYFVILYRALNYKATVTLSINDGEKSLSKVCVTHERTKIETVAVKVIDDDGSHGVTLKAGHHYDILVNVEIEACCLNWAYLPVPRRSFQGTAGQSEITVDGVKFSFRRLDGHSTTRTNVSDGHIQGFRFSVV